MSFTYEKEDKKTPLEAFEWDNVWLERTDFTDRKRVLYIGDSISCGTRREATVLSDSTFLFDGFGTSKAVDNPYFQDSLRLFAAQEGYRSAIVFNNGLHGWHLNDTEEYPAYYKKTVDFLIKEFPDTPIFLALTTAVKDEAREIRVCKRNEEVMKIAREYSLEIIDLHSVSAAAPELLANDGVHFTKEGYQALARKILEAISK